MSQTQSSNQVQSLLQEALEKFDLEKARKVFEMLKDLPLNEMDKEVFELRGLEEKEVIVKRFPDRVLNEFIPTLHYCSEALGQLDPVLNTWNVVRIYKRLDGYRVRFLAYDKIYDREELRATYSIGRVIDALDVLCNLLHARVVADP
jgi:hypothetical protein